MTTDEAVSNPLPLIPPTPGQLAWQRSELGVFFHFGVNTFAGLEWSDGTLDPASFNPHELDARQWMSVAAEAGARYVILTAKHHDGFCLWPTDTTDYSVASSPWRDGRGDVVAEVSAAAAEFGLQLGLYLSPWDRHADCYPDPAAYDRYYQDQLRELCTRYGPLTELWFDGAGSQGRSYDWVGIGEVIAETQPDAMIFNMGDPTIRWVGNEDGLAADPVNYVVAETDFSQYTVESTRLDQALYLPPECDVSIRRGWFWADHDRPKSLDHLIAIYYKSIGMGANLLLNLPPDDRGLIPDADRERVRQWRTELDRRFAEPNVAELIQLDARTWQADFGALVSFDHLELVEDYTSGQRIRQHKITVLTEGEQGFDNLSQRPASPEPSTTTSQLSVLASGQTIGNKRLHAFSTTTADRVVITVEGRDPKLESVRAYATGVTDTPDLAYLASTETPD